MAQVTTCGGFFVLRKLWLRNKKMEEQIIKKELLDKMNVLDRAELLIFVKEMMLCDFGLDKLGRSELLMLARGVLPEGLYALGCYGSFMTPKEELLKKMNGLNQEELQLFVKEELLDRELLDKLNGFDWGELLIFSQKVLDIVDKNEYVVLLNLIKFGLHDSKPTVAGGICHQLRTDIEYNGGFPHE